MGVLDWILVIFRWGHALAAVAWVGGGAFYLLVLRPAIRRTQGVPPDTGEAIRDEFRGLVTTAIMVLLLTGAILSVARLTSEAATVSYAIVLGVKIALALYMFYAVRIVRRGDYAGQQDEGSNWLRRAARRVSSPMALLVIGIAVIGLSDVLDALIENAPVT
ncbi:hypothetical protein GBAR_LOCUS25974 [Geodia barretti]|uniref:Copper resistance protein D domain-containing protein n=1 Tax=Geodia barretti TaxID=519541 RepID=A0AA35TER4_GEOBA|nr:hypothetical protein GBAR_LOCUS25974 [Geodia barretti]